VIDELSNASKACLIPSMLDIFIYSL